MKTLSIVCFALSMIFGGMSLAIAIYEIETNRLFYIIAMCGFGLLSALFISLYWRKELKYGKKED